jgi:hypothetical protein
MRGVGALGETELTVPFAMKNPRVSLDDALAVALSCAIDCATGCAVTQAHRER